MLKFDLMDTVAGRQLYDMGQQKGHHEGHHEGLKESLQKELINVRDMLLDVLVARFGLVSNKIVNKIRAIDQLEVLKSLHGEAIRCPNIGIFKERLSS